VNELGMLAATTVVLCTFIIESSLTWSLVYLIYLMVTVWTL